MRRVADWWRWGGVGLLWVASWGCGSQLFAATPDSPEYSRDARSGHGVSGTTFPRDRRSASQLGGESLIGLAAYKYQRRYQPTAEDMPALTRQALSRAVLEAANSTKLRAVENYSLGLTLIFLT